MFTPANIALRARQPKHARAPAEFTPIEFAVSFFCFFCAVIAVVVSCIVFRKNQMVAAVANGQLG